MPWARLAPQRKRAIRTQCAVRHKCLPGVRLRCQHGPHYGGGKAQHSSRVPVGNFRGWQFSHSMGIKSLYEICNEPGYQMKSNSKSHSTHGLGSKTQAVRTRTKMQDLPSRLVCKSGPAWRAAGGRGKPPNETNRSTCRRPLSVISTVGNSRTQSEL